MQENPHNADVGTAIILQQLDQLNKRMDAGFERGNINLDKLTADMKAYMDKYVLTAVHDLEIKRLDEKDKEQEDHLQRLEDRVLSQGQRYFLYACSGTGLVSTLIVIAHALHLF